MRNQKRKAVFNWSGGKDSALALHKTLNENQFDVVSLLTTLNEETLRSSVHNIPLELLRMQSESLGIPLYVQPFAKDLNNYDDKMQEVVSHFKKQNVTHFIFGDISLSGIKRYRESKLNPVGIKVIEPLWNKTSREIINEYFRSGIRSRIIVTQADKLDRTNIGKELDKAFVNALPGDVDVCGENGEFHTLSYSGGSFTKEIIFSLERSYKISYDIKSDTGQIKTYEYWQAAIQAS